MGADNKWPCSRCNAWGPFHYLDEEIVCPSCQSKHYRDRCEKLEVLLKDIYRRMLIRNTILAASIRVDICKALGKTHKEMES